MSDNDNDDDDNYKSIIAEVKKAKTYESRGDKGKNLSVKQYLYKIMPCLSELINEHKAIENNSMN